MKSIFSPTEIERRWSELRNRLHPAECAVIPSFHNSYHQSGMPMVQWGRYAVTVIFAEREPSLIIPDFEISNARRNSPIDDVRVYSDDHLPSVLAATELVSDLLKEQSVGCVGVEGLGMPTAMYRGLVDRHPTCEFVDVTEAVDGVRLVSSPEEIEIIRVANRAASVGLERILDMLAPGVLQSDLRIAAEEAITAAIPSGVEWNTNCFMQQGMRSFESHAGAVSLPVVEGEILQVNCEAEVFSYQGVVERAIIVGQGSDEVERAYRTMIDAFAAACERCRPGMRYSDVDAGAREVFERNGYPFKTGGLARGLVHHTGGRIKAGDFRPFNDRVIEAGTVLTPEPWGLMPGVGAPRHSSQVLPTNDGPEFFDGFDPGELRITGVAREVAAGGVS